MINAKLSKLRFQTLNEVILGPMRITLYTDTLGDVSGVCRFIQDMARLAQESGRDLTVVTSTANCSAANGGVDDSWISGLS